MEEDAVSGTVRTRTNLALHHLFVACRFSARVGEIEIANTGLPLAAFWEEILHNSLGVAVLTVAALESYANEMYFEGSVLKQGVNAAVAAELAEIIDRESILTKHSLALSISAGKKLDLGLPVTQNVDTLIKLRNAVVHFRPEWFDEQDKHEKLSVKLRINLCPQRFSQTSPYSLEHGRHIVSPCGHLRQQ